MKIIQSQRPAPESSPARADRRGLVVGVGVAGAAAVAVHALGRGLAEAPVAGAAKALPVKGDGYQLTQHVLRYYETTKA
ncbi:MAG TPA: formate dehydrogenase [Caldimonas sp.]